MAEQVVRPVHVAADEFRHAPFVMLNLKHRDGTFPLYLLTPAEADNLAAKLTWRAERVRAKAGAPARCVNKEDPEQSPCVRDRGHRGMCKDEYGERWPHEACRNAKCKGAA